MPPSADRGPSPLRPPTTPFRLDSQMSPIDKDLHPVIHSGRVAVVTGAASGIGAAAAREFAKLGLKVAIADWDEENLNKVAKELVAQLGEPNVIAVRTDVSKLEDVVSLKDRVYEAWGEVAVLLNNAAIGGKTGSWEGLEAWRKIMDVNLFGVLNVQHTFVPAMLHQENQSAIINTGSKQGITNPPGSGPAYNASKAAIKSITESLAHELRQRPAVSLTAHLFIPGWTFTGLGGARDPSISKPPGAWTATETVLYMLDRVRLGDFYILCPDNETRRDVDNLRILWGAGDITEGRPALSRWHPNYKSLFEDYMKEGLADLDQ